MVFDYIKDCIKKKNMELEKIEQRRKELGVSKQILGKWIRENERAYERNNNYIDDIKKVDFMLDCIERGLKYVLCVGFPTKTR